MVTLRKDVRNLTLFRMAFSAKPVRGTGRIPDLENFDQQDVMRALEDAVDAGTAVQGYRLTGGAPVDGIPDDNMAQVWLEQISDLKAADGSSCGWILRFAYQNPRAAGLPRRGGPPSKLGSGGYGRPAGLTGA
jgi:hypothetical protein